MITTYPRLPAGAAVERLIELTAMPWEQLLQSAELHHSQSYWYPTGARRSEDDLRRLADVVRSCAADNGWPKPLGGRSTAATNFDRELSGVLLRDMEIIPADAADEGVWSYLSLVLLPDVAFWRFPNTQARADYERLLGRPRNVFRRLWSRAFTLGTEASVALFEDEAVNIMERPSLAGDRRLAQAIVRRHLAMATADPSLPRTELLRQVAKRMLRLSAVLTVPALNDQQVEQLVDEVALASRSALQYTRAA